MKKKVIALNYKGDDLIAEWAVLDTAAFLYAQQVVREKIQQGYILINNDKEEVVKELDSESDHTLIPQIMGG